jgi:hypothetical protein
MSVSQSNSTQTIERPALDAERTRCTPLAPFIIVSIGKVTRASVSSGARPCASVRIVTTGRFRSGSTSTGILATTPAP